MNVVRLAAWHVAAAGLLLPLACAADGLLRGSLPGPTVVTADPLGMQVIPLPSGALLRRLPGQVLPGDPGAAPPASGARLAAGVTVEQSGAAQLRVRGAPASPTPAPQVAGLTVRQVGAAQLRELPAARSLAQVAPADVPPALAGLVVVDLAPGQPLPAQPAPATLYRRLPTPP